MSDYYYVVLRLIHHHRRGFEELFLFFTGAFMTDGTNTVLFYQKPVLLDRATHRGAKIKLRDANFEFSRQTNSVPVAALEFARAATEYPIVFAGPSTDRLMPVVVLGLRNNENLFVDVTGKWANGYIPAFIRRYPFVLAERNNGQDFSVCIDTAFPGWEAPDGDPLFADTGAESPLLKNVLAFLGQYQGNIQHTQAFTGKLNELNLLVGREIRARDTKHQPLALRGFYAVDEAKLNALSNEQITELYRCGLLGLIHAHLISLGNVVKLEQQLRDRE